jgi:hypothetical protein
MNMIRDPLDDMLKADAQSHRDQYIDDAGFTLRVMDDLLAMPAPTQLSRSMRMGIPFGLALIGALFVTLFTGGKNFFIDVTMDLATETITRDVVALGLIAVALFAMLMASLVNDK